MGRSLAGFDIVMGHFSLSTLEGCCDHSDIAVLLREPLARLLSPYQFWRGWEEPMHELLVPCDASRRAAQASFDDFVQDPALASKINNLALRWSTRRTARAEPTVPATGGG